MAKGAEKGLTYYAIKQGVKEGVFPMTWEEARPLVVGNFTSQFLSFKNEADAQAYYDDSETQEGLNLVATDDFPEDVVVLYTDGSFADKTKTSAYAFVAVKEGKVLYRKSGISDTEFKESRNVASEITAIKEAVKWAYSNGYKKIILRYDLEGLGFWISGSWHATVELTKTYVAFIQDYLENKHMEITFEKVNAHSDDKFNNQVDKLAKEEATKA